MDAVLEALMVFVSALGGSTLTAFWKKKAENYATKQDVAELTGITKRVEAKISSEVWDRQKQWELKREVLFAAMKSVTECDIALVHLEKKDEESHEVHRKAAKQLDEANLLIDISCSSELSGAFDDYVCFANSISDEIHEGKRDVYERQKDELEDKLETVRQLVRKELGIKYKESKKGKS